MHNRIRAFLAAMLVTGCAAASVTAQAASVSLKGKLWIVDVNTAISPFSPPTATPDATFSTQVANFGAQGPTTSNTNLYVGYTVGAWLNSYAKAKGLIFSGQENPYINAAVSAGTLLGDGVGYGGTDGSYGTMIELTGTITLAANELISVSSSDGLSVSIDGVNQIQHSGPGGVNETYFWPGTAGTHKVQMLFAECCGGGAGFGFSPLPRMTPQ